MDNMLYTIEPVTKKNVDDLRKMRIYKEQRGFISDIDTSLIQASFLPGWCGRVLRYNDEIVGFGAYSEKEPKVAKINKIMIDRNHQGKGHGNKLLELILDEISSQGYTTVILNTNAKNSAAISLYMKHGFILCNGGYQHPTDVLMSKKNVKY